MNSKESSKDDDDVIQSISLDILKGDILIDGVKEEYAIKPLYKELIDTTIANGNNHMNDAFAATVESLVHAASSDPATLFKVSSTHPNDVLTMNRNFMSLEENLESARFVECCYECENESKDFSV